MKLGLAIGYKLVGSSFLATEYAKHLRKGFFEGDSAKRREIPVRGMPFLNGQLAGQIANVLFWPGAWVLILVLAEEKLHLSVI